MPRYFTIEEANAALQEIRPLLEQIMRIRADVLARRPDVWPVIEKSAGNGGSKAASEVEREFERLDGYVHRIQEMGVVVKDINIGLIDFPALRGGREIYLCWRMGEPEVLFWHEVDAGFGGRQRLSP